MNKEIWRFEPSTIEIPKGAEILTAQECNGDIFIWALVDPEAQKEKRTFEVFETGQQIYYDMGVSRNYIATVQLRNSLVFHVFENTGV